MREKYDSVKMNELEKIYGEDIIDLLYSINELCKNRLEDSFYYLLFDSNKIMLYYGDSDIKNCIVIFNEDIENLRFFSNEDSFKIVKLFDLLEIIKELIENER